MCALMGAPCSHESSKFVFVSGMSRIRTVLFHLPGHLLVLCFLLRARLHRDPNCRWKKCRILSPRHVCGCSMRVLLVLSHGFLVLSSLFLRHGSQIQSTIHQRETHCRDIGNHGCGTTQDKHTRLLLDLVKKLLCLLRASTWSSMYAFEKPGKQHHGVSAGKGVDFLRNQQLPPEHVDVVGRFLLASRKGRAAELHALLTWWSHRNRCTVL